MLLGSRISSMPSWQPRQPFSLDTDAVIFDGTSPCEIVEANKKISPQNMLLFGQFTKIILLNNYLLTNSKEDPWKTTFQNFACGFIRFSFYELNIRIYIRKFTMRKYT